MASLGHVAVGLAAARAYGGRRPGWRMAAFGALSLAPDADVIGLSHGVPYGSPLGHRGASHSLLVALLAAFVIAAAATFVSRPPARATPPPSSRGARSAKLFVFLLLVIASHGLLDAMTDGGRGVALSWPWTRARLFFPWRPIPVAPIGARILSARGLHAMLFELAAFAPFWLYAIFPRRRERAR